MFEELTVRVGADISDFRAGLAKAFSSAKDLGGSMADAFKDLTRNAAIAGATISATIGVGTTMAAKAAADFEHDLAAVSTVVDLTADGLKRLGEGQRDLAKEFGTDLHAQMTGLYDAISAGVTDAAHATEYMRNVDRLAVAGMSDVKTAGEALIRMMKAYGPETMTAARASDLLLQISNKGVTTFEQLAPNIGKVAGLAAQAGISAEQMGAALATITGTASTEESITQLSHLISDIIKPTDDAKAAAKSLGIQWDAVSLSTNGLSGLMTQLGQKLGVSVTADMRKMLAAGADTNVVLNQMSAASGVQINKLAELFPNVNALRSALALMANDGKNFADTLAAMGESTGQTGIAFAKMGDTATQKWNVLTAKILDMKIAIGAQLIPVLEQLAARFEPILQSVSDWIAKNPELAAHVADMTVRLVAGAAALGIFGVAMNGVAAVFGVLSAAVRIAALSVSALGLLFSPIGLVIGAVAAVVAYFGYQWVQSVGGVGPAWKIAVETVTRYGSAAVQWFTTNWPIIRDTIVGTWNAVVAAFKPAVLDVWSFFREVTGAVIDWFAQRWPAIVEIFSNTWRVVEQFWTTVGVPIWQGIKDFVENVWELIKGIVRAAGNILAGIMDVFMGGIRGNWEQVWTGIKEIASGIWGVIESGFVFFWSELASIVLQSGRLTLNLWTGLWESMKAVFVGIWDSITSYFKAAFDKITGWITTIFGWVGELGRALGGGIADGFSWLRDIVGFDTGGWISGHPGTDTNVIRVSDGEFVVNDRAASMFGPVLEAINAMGNGGGGGGNAYFGATNISLPNVRTADARGVRELAAGLDRVARKGQSATNRRGSR